MPKLEWDKAEERLYETGVDCGVLFPYANGAPGTGVVWNGLSSVSESPEGAEATDVWADNMKYVSMRSAENFKGTIEAYMSPEEFDECDGSVAPAGTVGLKISQQARKPFGFSYRTKVGNAATGDEFGYIIHLVYGATAAPSERQYQTVNDSPEAMTLSWEFDTTPVAIAGYKPTAHLEIDSTKCKTAAEKACLAALEKILYGSDTVGEEAGSTSRLPLPAEVITIMTPSTD